jgi:hypothetical protein
MYCESSTLSEPTDTLGLSEKPRLGGASAEAGGVSKNLPLPNGFQLSMKPDKCGRATSAGSLSESNTGMGMGGDRDALRARVCSSKVSQIFSTRSGRRRLGAASLVASTSSAADES